MPRHRLHREVTVARLVLSQLVVLLAAAASLRVQPVAPDVDAFLLLTAEAVPTSGCVTLVYVPEAVDVYGDGQVIADVASGWFIEAGSTQWYAYVPPGLLFNDRNDPSSTPWSEETERWQAWLRLGGYLPWVVTAFLRENPGQILSTEPTDAGGMIVMWRPRPLAVGTGQPPPRFVELDAEGTVLRTWNRGEEPGPVIEYHANSEPPLRFRGRLYPNERYARYAREWNISPSCDPSSFTVELAESLAWKAKTAYEAASNSTLSFPGQPARSPRPAAQPAAPAAPVPVPTPGAPPGGLLAQLGTWQGAALVAGAFACGVFVGFLLRRA